MNHKLAFIGCGNIASAMIRGIVTGKIIEAGKVTASDPSVEKITSMKNELGINVTTDNLEAVANGEIIFLCVEPNMSSKVIAQIKDSIGENQIVISVAAGVSLSDLYGWLNPGTKVVRIMPNLPISVGEGLTMICETDLVTKEELEEIVRLLSSFGKVEIMNEKYMNAFVALASSSPAFVYVMIEAMADAAVAMGLSRKRSYKIVSQAVLGAAKMVVETGKHPGELKDMVCSPAGTTIDAVASLEESGFRYSIIKALKVGEEKCSRISK